MSKNNSNMTGNLILTKESSPSVIECYFRGVLALDQQEKVFSVNLDDVWQLCYTEKSKAVRALKTEFIENVDFIVLAKNGENPLGGEANGLLFPHFRLFGVLHCSQGAPSV